MEARNAEAKTPLHQAVAAHDLPKCVALVKEGADVDAVDRCGISPLEEASLRGFQDIFDVLQPYSKKTSPRTWDLSEVTCPICFAAFVKPITILCGHTFCRSCLQLSRRPHNRCCLCRKPVQFENGYQHNTVLEQLVLSKFPEEYKNSEKDHAATGAENAIANLKDLMDNLGFPVVFNEKNTCVLRIDGEFSMHMTFLSDKKQLFVYAPLLEGFPQSDLVLLEIFDKLMQGIFEATSIMMGGGVGIIGERELIVMHMELDMVNSPSITLRVASTVFVEMVKYWRNSIANIITLSEGKNSPHNSPPKRRRAPSLGSLPLPVKKRCYSHLIASSATAETRERAKANIRELAREMGIDIASLEDHEGTSLVVKGLSITYDQEADQIILSSPALQGLPITVSPKLRLRLLSRMLEGATFGSLMQGGGCGLKVDEAGTTDQIVIFARARLRHMESDRALVEFAQHFKETIDKWQKILSNEIRSFQMHQMQMQQRLHQQQQQQQQLQPSPPLLAAPTPIPSSSSSFAALPLISISASASSSSSSPLSASSSPHLPSLVAEHTVGDSPSPLLSRNLESIHISNREGRNNNNNNNNNTHPSPRRLAPLRSVGAGGSSSAPDTPTMRRWRTKNTPPAAAPATSGSGSDSQTN